VLLVSAGCGDDDDSSPPVTTEPAPERDATQQTIEEEAAGALPTPDCDAAFARAAGGAAGSVDDLGPAARDCISLDDWIAADAAHPAALDGADPATAVRDACEADDDLADAPLCEEVLG
jgi:hypothetical protein